jgi:cellulose synthase/poly-beta-1,6-N-acetylglucosamine synthase-like glycosyltransferase
MSSALHIIAAAAILSQLLLVLLIYRNFRYVLAKQQPRTSVYHPVAALIVPCKGLDGTFEKNIASFLDQDYPDYRLWFVVEGVDDPAHGALRRIENATGGSCRAAEIRVLVAGRSERCSQKNHNLLYCCERVHADVEVLAFADSDVCVRSDWLARMVHPLRKPNVGASTGYRWFIPQRTNLASLALSAMNAKVAQFLGNTPFNKAWGGSMAIKAGLFRQVELDKIWSRSLSDDLSLSAAVKRARRKIAFVPAALAASYASTTWRDMFEFGRRQFLITRVYAAGTWLLALFSALYSVTGLWGCAAAALAAAACGRGDAPLFAAVSAAFLAGQAIRAVLRQAMMARVMGGRRGRMEAAAIADVAGCWAWSAILLVLVTASAFGRTIHWRGIRYRLRGPLDVAVEREPGAK